jgi:hypothetical protein
MKIAHLLEQHNRLEQPDAAFPRQLDVAAQPEEGLEEHLG